MSEHEVEAEAVVAAEKEPSTLALFIAGMALLPLGILVLIFLIDVILNKKGLTGAFTRLAKYVDDVIND